MLSQTGHLADYCLKTLRKADMLQKSQVVYVQAEKNLLASASLLALPSLPGLPAAPPQIIFTTLFRTQTTSTSHLNPWLVATC